MSRLEKSINQIWKVWRRQSQDLLYFHFYRKMISSLSPGEIGPVMYTHMKILLCTALSNLGKPMLS